jgi:chromosomal replication initiator protein
VDVLCSFTVPPMNMWELIKNQLALKLSSESFQNWFGRTSLRDASDDTLWVAVPDEAARDYIEQVYADAVYTAIRDLGLPIQRIVYELPARPGSSATTAQTNPDTVTDISFKEPATQINPRFTFDTFVVGSCNQFAHAAAKAVASKPSETYNPLFIYGGVGMGKTHLMHAIGRALLDNYQTMRIVYTSSERFMNEMIASIRLQKMAQFHQHYRSADVLLVDDIHILGKREATQEEFFHTFNELYEHQKQIIISSDSPPQEIPGLVERLRSRFQWGLQVDIQPPDLETKMAILDKKAEQEGFNLPEDVRIFIATKIKSNIRELEGSLVKLVAYSSVTGSPITLAMAQQALKHLLSNSQDRRITIDAIVRVTATKFGLQPSQLKQKSNAKAITEPRQIAMYLAKELTRASLPEIGRAFGGKHHTTVLHSIRKVEKNRHSDPDLNRVIHSLIDSFH